MSKHTRTRNMSAEKATVAPVRPTNAIAELESDTNIYNCLRTRIHKTNRVPAFTMGQVWAKDKLCVEAAASYHVAVYLPFRGVEDMTACWGPLRKSLAVNATAHRLIPATGGASIILLFSALSPLVGPMTYGEVERAVQHYLGWCSNRTGDNPPWGPTPRFVTVELVEQSTLREWLEQRRSAISACERTGFVEGSGLRCKTPCVPDLREKDGMVDTS